MMDNMPHPSRAITGRRSLLVMLGLIGLGWPLPTHADVYCGGDAPALRILTYSDGAVSLLTSWRGDYLQICNLNRTWKGVEPATCFAWMSQIASSINSGKRMGIHYGGLTGDACRTMPTYGNAPAPVYVDIAS